MISGLMAMIKLDNFWLGPHGESGARFLAPAVFLSVVATFWPLGTTLAFETSLSPLPHTPPAQVPPFLGMELCGSLFSSVALV